jgi:hypothetical protein
LRVWTTDAVLSAFGLPFGHDVAAGRGGRGVVRSLGWHPGVFELRITKEEK